MTLRLVATALLALLALPGLASAAGPGQLDVAWWSAGPFVLLLLCIAILPLVAEHWWHSNRNKAIVAILFAGPVVAYLVSLGDDGKGALLHELAEYFSFIVLLWSLYTIAGGIVVEGDFRGTPLNNLVLLAIGSCLASFIGTTGASMLLIRPFLRMNHGRKRIAHLPIFFIFTVSNLGGLLTPLGDPPLFLGFIKGIAFEWTLFNLWYEWAITNAIVLFVFLIWDSLAYLGDRLPVVPEAERKPFRIRGGFNFLLLLGVMLAVLSKSWLKDEPIAKYFPSELAQIALALLSLILTSRPLRQANRFTWGPIVEVAVLFVGIFVAMVPALKLLENNSSKFPVDEPWQYFWLTGSLSSFLDNAPTYATFGTLAASKVGGSDLNFAPLMEPGSAAVLAAISCGAVFMGAMTYIGNGPNFMVKAMAEEDGVKMPSFFGYMAYSIGILIPIFVLLTYLFFRPSWL